MIRAHSLVHPRGGQFALTDLTKTRFDGVRSKFFRLFVPVKRERLRLPTSLPQFRHLRHVATLSDSPLLAAKRLGGHWSEHNLAAIVHVASCNLRCPYCYVDYRHLSGKDSFLSNAREVVEAFVALRQSLASEHRNLSILRLSGGEPLLAPDLLANVVQEFARRDLFETCVVKVESNLTAFPFALEAAGQETVSALRQARGRLVLHATIHSSPTGKDWGAAMNGLRTALDLRLDVYPAIGGADWTMEELITTHASLSSLSAELPLRLAVRPFNLSYEVLSSRRGLERFHQHGTAAPSELWETILLERHACEYLATPRHEVRLYDSETSLT